MRRRCCRNLPSSYAEQQFLRRSRILPARMIRLDGTSVITASLIFLSACGQHTPQETLLRSTHEFKSSKSRKSCSIVIRSENAKLELMHANLDPNDETDVELRCSDWKHLFTRRLHSLLINKIDEIRWLDKAESVQVDLHATNDFAGDDQYQLSYNFVLYKLDFTMYAAGELLASISKGLLGCLVPSLHA